MAIEQYLTGLISDPDLLLETLDEIHDICAAQVGMQECFGVLDSAGVEFAGMEQAGEMMQLIVDLQNHTRLWANFGHTPNELQATCKSNLIAFPSAQPARSNKTGRNDPCPCGSGKKYKNCCGK